MGYNEAYLIDLIHQGNSMLTSSKLSLLRDRDYIDEEEFIDAGIAVLKQLNYKHWKAAKQYSGTMPKDKLDHYLAIDDLLLDERSNDEVYIGIDWTLNKRSVVQKIEKHKWMKRAHRAANIDHTCVVHVSNEEVLELYDDATKASVLYRVLEKVANEVIKPNFLGAVAVDIKDLV